MAQVQKPVLHALRTEAPVKIDAVLDEPDWNRAPTASEFIQLEPNPGLPAIHPTETWILYDDKAIYIGAKIYCHPDEISDQLFERDNLDDEPETDWFGVAFDTYMDGINGFAFLVTPAGVQIDLKFISSDDEDFAWDAVWNSAVVIVDDGWVVEMEIPYSALRFPDREIQRWHLQIGLSHFKTQEESYWSPVDPKVDGFLLQSGILEGIRDIKAPLRLSATPFFAVYGENYHDKSADPKSVWGNSFNGGMDIRYGISDAFTLDMTVVPDFGQVQSDNEVLNLSPFEVQFNENRQFFTEGTELFGKANLFYSRRVGGRPLYYGEVQEGLGPDEELISNPVETQLYNATKISGRTPGGTGLGFFNAIAGREYAIIRNADGVHRKVETNPLTNYNVMVLDQNLKNNSSISFINTNVWRSGHAYDANVTGTAFAFRNKKNTYSLIGNAAVSQLYQETGTDLGYKYFIEFGKQSGAFTWEVANIVESHNYDPNDLGFIFNNNEVAYQGVAEYSIYKPFGKWLRMSGEFYSRLAFLDKFTGTEVPQLRDNLFIGWQSNFSWNATTHQYIHTNLWTSISPVAAYDYFEPRIPGRYYEIPPYVELGGSIRTDTRKNVWLGVGGSYSFVDQPQRSYMSAEIESAFRISNKFSLGYEIEIEHARNDEGHVTDFNNDDIVFGRRDVTDIVNLIRAQYAFNPKMHISLRMRHNWTKVEYNSFHQLTTDGILVESDYDENEDINFNAFTIDAVYRWRFAPGSDVFIVWKNSIIAEEEHSDHTYWRNFGQLTDLPMRNSLSLKILYYLDVGRLKR
jgi:hypothetical protein